MSKGCSQHDAASLGCCHNDKILRKKRSALLFPSDALPRLDDLSLKVFDRVRRFETKLYRLFKLVCGKAHSVTDACLT